MYTYLPSAKHSILTVDPLAAVTVYGKWTSIFGSYSPITPGKQRKIFTSKIAVDLSLIDLSL